MIRRTDGVRLRAGIVPALDHERGRLQAMADRLRGRSYAECGPDVADTDWHAGYATGWVYLVAGHDRPLSYAEAVATRPERTEAECQRLEALEANVGRLHEDGDDG